MTGFECQLLRCSPHGCQPDMFQSIPSPMLPQREWQRERAHDLKHPVNMLWQGHSSTQVHTKSTMDAAVLCFALGHQPSSNIVGDCLELRACGLFKKQHFLRGLQAAQDQLITPVQLIEAISKLIQHQLFGPELLQALLPDPADACHTIHQACSSLQCTQQLLLMQSFKNRTTNATDTCYAQQLPAAVQLIRLMLLQAFGTAATPAVTGQDTAEDLALRQYVISVVQNLQEAAAVHEVLAVCLFQAAASCTAICGFDVISRWMCQQLPILVTACSAASMTPAQQQAATLAKRSWNSAAFQHKCWCFIMPCLLSCGTDVNAVLQVLQDCMAEAVTTAQGLDKQCAVLNGIQRRSSEHKEVVHDMLASAICLALKEGSRSQLLQPLLLCHRMLDNFEYKQVLTAAVKHSLAAENPNSAASWLCLLDAINLTLPAADESILMVHQQLLQEHLPSTTGITHGRISGTLETIRDVAQGMKQQQTPTEKAVPPLTAGHRASLEQFSQLPRVNGRRQMTDVLKGQWRFNRGYVPTFCDVISLNAFQTVEDARIRFEYLLAFQDINLLPQKQMHKFYDTLDSCGIDRQALCDSGVAAANGGQPPCSPIAVLQQLLGRLPGTVNAQQPQAMSGLLRRISDQLQSILKETQQHGATTVNADEPAAKRHCSSSSSAAAANTTAAAVGTQAAVGSSNGSMSQLQNQLTHMFLDAFCALVDRKASTEWRFGLVEVLHEAKSLHGNLVQQLLASMTGSSTSHQAVQAFAHGRLLAIMAACKPSQLLLLQQGSEALVTQHDCAAPMHVWHCRTSSVATSDAAPSLPAMQTTAATSAGCPSVDLHGPELVQEVMSHVSLDTASRCCCAVSFWAGYALEVKSVGRWCAGIQGPLQKERPNSAGGSTSQPPQAVVTAGQQQQCNFLGFVPMQLVAVLSDLQQQLLTAAAAEGVQQHEQQMLQECIQACSKALGSKPLKWIHQQYTA